MRIRLALNLAKSGDMGAARELANAFELQPPVRGAVIVARGHL